MYAPPPPPPTHTHTHEYTNIHTHAHRLTSFEKARIYEQTPSESWLDEVDGDVSLLAIDLELLEDDEDMVSCHVPCMSRFSP